MTKEIPVSADIDILFVIDNSSSTSDKQQLLGSNFGNFTAALDAFPTGRPNLHIGVVDSTVDLGVQGLNGCPSPDPGDNGILQNSARVTGCTPPTGRFISDIKNADGTRTENYGSETLASALTCIAEIGTGGCGFEAPLESMKRALDSSNTANAGFIRDGAYLAVVFLTDEDDASLKDGAAGNAVFALPPQPVMRDYRVQPQYAYQCDQPMAPETDTGSNTYTNCTARTDSYLQDPASYSAFLAGVKDPARTVVAVIGGQPPGLTTNDMPGQVAGAGGVSAVIATGSQTIGSTSPQDPALLATCSTTIAGATSVARPALRLATFLSAYGDRGKFYTICQPDYSAALKDIGATLFNAISPCLEGPLDTADADPNNPGTQLQCSVSDVADQGGSDQSATAIPPCKMASATMPDPSATYPNGACWWTDMNATSCPAPDTGYEVNFVRTQPAATGTTTDVECAVSSM